MAKKPLRQNKSWAVRAKETRRQLPAILKALLDPALSISEIGRRFNRSQTTINRINQRYGVRPPSEVMRIRKEQISAMQRRRRQRLNLFKAKQKASLLEEHKKGLSMVVGKWWRKASDTTKRELGTFGDFRNSVIANVLENLDYYDPNRKGAKGRGMTVFSWMTNGADLFCRNAIRVAMARSKEMPIIYEGAGVRMTKPLESDAYFTVDTIPESARHFLRRLGEKGIIKRTAELGFEDIKKQILKIADKAGLSEKEKQVVKWRLEGKMLQEIVMKFGASSTTTVSYYEKKAIAKIRAAIKRKTGFK